MNDATPIINQLFLALQNVRFYPPTHSLVQQSVSSAYLLLRKILAAGKDFSFGFLESKLIVNGQPLAADPSQTKSLGRQFEIMRIGAVTFQAGLAQAELRSFLECLAIKPEQLNEAGGIKKALADRAVQHVQVNDVRYGRVAAKEPGAYEDYRKALRRAGRGIPSGAPAFGAHPVPPPPAGAPEPGRPSPEELRELFALRERFDAELDRKVREITRNYEIDNRRLAFEKGAIESIMQNIGEGVVVIGNDGNIMMANPAAEKLLSKQGKAIVGRTLKESLREEHSLVLSRGNPEFIKDIEVSGKNEETRQVLRSSNAVVQDLDGRIVGMVSVLSDITKMKEVEQLKSDFVANVSHELRSPLIAIQKNLGLILDQSAGAINASQKEFLALAKDNVERLNRLINDLLDLSKIEAGKMELRKTRLDLNALLRDAVAGFAGWFREKNISVRLDLPDAPLEVEADADKITQVMNNLVSNALKFTPSEGKIRIALNASAGQIEISVTDTGIGIDVRDIRRIFNKFEQVNADHPIGANGTGLGLFLARQIVEQHGGGMQVVSEKGKGSTFSFSLPRRPLT